MVLIALFALASLSPQLRADDVAASLPDGVKAVWDVTKAYHETTPTRERICLNGLWRWQPADAESPQVPAGRWGFFKVPGCWPGFTDYMQKDAQTLYVHPSWKKVRLGGITAAWYEREITIPDDWFGRRIFLHIEYLNSYSVVFVDGVKRGEIRFPDGEVDLTTASRSGAAHRLSLLVVALPLKAVLLSYTDTASAREVKGTVERRGLCGDVFIVSTPSGPKIADVAVDTSVRRRELTISAAVDGLAPKVQYHLRARITRGGSLVKELAGKPFKDGELKDVRLANCCDTRIARAGQNSVRTDSESPPLRSMAWRAFGLRSRERRSRRRSRTGAGWPPLSSVPTARGCSPVFPITRCACGTRKRGGFSPRRSSMTASSGVPVSARMAKTDPQASSDEVTPPVRESPVHLAA